MTPNAIFRIASMSKPVGAVAILMLIEVQGSIKRSVSRHSAYAKMQVGVAQPRRPGFGPPPDGAGSGAAPEFYTTRRARHHDPRSLTHTSGLAAARWAIGRATGLRAAPRARRRVDRGHRRLAARVPAGHALGV
jgi:hypothetical protein